MMQNNILVSIIVLLIPSLHAQLVINTEDPTTLSESEAKVGTVVFNFTVTAIPPSSCDFTYEVDQPGIFSVAGSGGAGSDGYGTVTLNKELDYEEQTLYMVTLTATQPCDESMTAEKTLTIILEDTNDNAPYYETSLITAINKIENDDDLFVTQLKAKDSDGSDEFNTNSIQFSFQGNYDGVLELKNNGVIIDGWATVDLYLSEPLDYEKSQCYQVHVIAKDCKGQCASVISSTAVVSFSVIDVDDQAPIFTLYTPYVEIPENLAVGTTVTTVKAVDGDYGLNQDIIYSFQNDSEWYQINPDSGEITVQKSLDREGEGYEQSGTALIIKATEVGNEESTAAATVTVRLTDVNDRPPTFSQSTYTGSVIESATLGFPVSLDNLIQVSDNDEEANAGFTVSIKEPNVPFQLSANEGVGTYLFAIVVNAPLDYNTQPSYILTVEATDKKDDTLKSNSTVTVSVLDDNAMTMVLDESSECLAVPENSPIGTAVCKFTVIYSNANNSASIKYNKMSGLWAKGLKLDKDTGIVTIDDPAIFDYESGKTFNVIVEPKDYFGLAKPAIFELTGTVTDMNDNSPNFSPSSGEGIIFNGANEFASPFIIQAVDADSGNNGMVNYRLVANGNEKYFKIEPHVHTQSGKPVGLISPVNTIDLASISACNYQDDVCNLELQIEAYDSGSPILTTSLTVTAKIMNCN